MMTTSESTVWITVRILTLLESTGVSIQGGVGEATVMLPSEVGVRAKAEGGIGKINAEGLTREGNSYVNDAYGNSDVILEVDVEGGVGEINLEVV
jgi:hypothetical protein